MARYGAFLWSGDVVLDVGNAEDARAGRGEHRVSAGFRTGAPTSAASCRRRSSPGELYVRWFQFGAFCPLFRAHGRTWHLRLPWGWNLGETGSGRDHHLLRAPALPPESELRNAQVEPICRKYLELRYRLMPYLYSAVRETSLTGHADHARAVAALSRRSGRRRARRPVSLGPRHPRGAGGREGRDVAAASTSRRGRAGSTSGPDERSTAARKSTARSISRRCRSTSAPARSSRWGPVKQYTAEPVDGPLTVTVYPGADGSFELFEDDGRSFEYRRGGWMGIAMKWSGPRSAAVAGADAGVADARRRSSATSTSASPGSERPPRCRFRARR